MNTYKVNFINTASLNLIVEADTEEQANEIAWQKFGAMQVRDPYMHWDIGFINELDEVNHETQ
jgi:hypothetical protein